MDGFRGALTISRERGRTRPEMPLKQRVLAIFFWGGGGITECLAYYVAAERRVHDESRWDEAAGSER
jgi:hypothetical protein